MNERSIVLWLMAILGSMASLPSSFAASRSEDRMISTTNQLYTLLAGQVYKSNQMDIEANDTANMGSIGYQGLDVYPHATTVKESKYQKVVMPSDYRTVRNIQRGSIRLTQQPLDVANLSAGYFMIDNKGKKYYTRRGSFAIYNNQLTTQEGDLVMSVDGSPITFPEDNRFATITSNGEIFVDGTAVGSIAIVDFSEPQKLKSNGFGLLSTPEIPTPVLQPRVMQGALEESNVEPVIQMQIMAEVKNDISMMKEIALQRYDLASKTINLLARIN
jgi:flagellar basal-body rod protein FlgF